MFSNRNSESKQNREESPLSEVKKQVRGLKKSNIKIFIKKALRSMARGERTTVNLMVFCCIATALALRIQLQVRDPRASIESQLEPEW